MPATPPFVVELSNRGNPDFGQDPRRPLPGTRSSRQRVTSLAAASEACRDYIARHQLGGGNWTGGRITDLNNELVGHVSYNGVVRAGKPGIIDAEVLYQPNRQGSAAEPAPDPFAFEARPVTVDGVGTFEIQGCFRVARFKDVPGTFRLNGQRVHLDNWLHVTPDGTIRVHRGGGGLIDGDFSKPIAIPEDVLDRIDRTLIAWASEPANFKLFVRNEILDRQRQIHHLQGRAASLEAELETVRREIEKELQTIHTLEHQGVLDQPDGIAKRP